MYTIEDLNMRLLSELKAIADALKVKNYGRLSKQELIYKILDQQAVVPEEVLASQQVAQGRGHRPLQRRPQPLCRLASGISESARIDPLLTHVHGLRQSPRLRWKPLNQLEAGKTRRPARHGDVSAG